MTAVRTVFAVALLALAFAGCGGDDEPAQPAADAPAAETTGPAAEPGPEPEDEALRPGGEEGLLVAAERARIVAQESDFGTVLFDANDQVVYVFEIDAPDQSNCVSEECVEAWPPVLTEEEPTAGEGVDAGLLGTIERDDGSRQVTYNGRPLYFYAHEGTGEIRCHNVDIHGGIWWVVTPAGEPAA